MGEFDYDPVTNAPLNCNDCVYSAYDEGIGVWCGFYRTHARGWEERYERCSKPWLEITWAQFKKR